ncbi:hypothetical protein HWQ46_21150 [Shewanella sp. D64]|uniref:hypothetical protein n=1 Tax=unclassified Shewanella TaxID=196818 RepID=UPI0022BA23E7|nr:MULTISPECIES: hypothetical protein [unclassified Shewanella]MEC4728047.1 hypothetical protein [Shewanella sp. D64]MEC4740108.1 hypothetical protein [Shewanella sp. E94]WBJ95170.1 hypothetical protein HWQ47_25770 [Shewanella sp. MTB7]
MIKKMMQKIIVLACSLPLSTSLAFASSQTAVTASLVKSEVNGTVLICQYRIMKQIHFKVLFSNETCPQLIQVDH